MAQKETLRFRPGTAADIVAHRIRLARDPSTFDNALPFVDVPVAAAPVEGDGYVRIKLSTYFPDADGVYDVYVTEVDDVGLESRAPLELQDNVFDFAPPDSPTDGAIE